MQAGIVRKADVGRYTQVGKTGRKPGSFAETGRVRQREAGR